MIQHSPILLMLLILSCCCIDAVRSQQRLAVAIVNRDNPAADVVRREYYEYDAPGARRYRRRRAGPFAGVVPGIFITLASSALQWYNEGRAVTDAQMLAYARRQTVELDPAAPIDPENDGRLVHVTGRVTTEGGLTDPDHGLFRPDALQLTSTTEAFQWNERRIKSKTRVSETETKVVVEYRYVKEWTKRHVESNRFQSPGHRNPYPNYRLGRNKMTAKDARMSNGLLLGPDLVLRLLLPNMQVPAEVVTHRQLFSGAARTCLTTTMPLYRRISFTSRKTGGRGNFSLWIVDPDSSKRHRPEIACAS